MSALAGLGIRLRVALKTPNLQVRHSAVRAGRVGAPSPGKLRLTFDENDGLFDHVAPPTPRAGTADEFVQGLPIGGGFRVPAIVISPWTVGGWVASEAFDHTSSLRFLEAFTGVDEPNISDWRRDTFGDFTSAFRFSHGRPRAPRLPDDTAEQLERAKEEVATLPKPTLPGGRQSFPRQEKGRRPRV